MSTPTITVFRCKACNWTALRDFSVCVNCLNGVGTVRDLYVRLEEARKRIAEMPEQAA